MKRLLMAAAGIVLTIAPMGLASAAAAQEWRGRDGRGQQGDGQRQNGQRPQDQRPQGQRYEGQRRDGGQRPDRAGVTRGERPQAQGQARLRAQAPAQVQPAQPAQPRVDRNPAVRQNESRWTDRSPAIRRDDRRGEAQRPTPRYDDRRGDQRWDDRRWDDRRDGRRYDGQRWDDRRGDSRRWSPNGYFGNGPRWQAPRRFRLPAYRPPIGFGYRSWSFGQILPPAYFGANYVLDDFWNYDLPEPPPGTFWVRSGPDALLVERGSGYVIEVVSDLFW